MSSEKSSSGAFRNSGASRSENGTMAPAQVVVCEGVPPGPQSRNMEHDAQCYNVIFESEFPDTKFLSAGNSSDVESHRLGFVAGIRSCSRLHHLAASRSRRSRT